MGLLATRRYGFVGEGQTVINTVAVASGIGMLASIPVFYPFYHGQVR